MGIAMSSATSTEGQQLFLLGNLSAVPTPKIKSARENSLRAQLCDDLNMRQWGQVCQRIFWFYSNGIRESAGSTGRQEDSAIDRDQGMPERNSFGVDLGGERSFAQVSRHYQIGKSGHSTMTICAAARAGRSLSGSGALKRNSEVKLLKTALTRINLG